MQGKGKGHGKDKPNHPETPEHPAQPEKPEHPEVIHVADQIAVLTMAGNQFLVGTVVRIGKQSITLEKAATIQFDKNSKLYYVAYPLSYPLVSSEVAEARHTINTAYLPSISLFDADSGHSFIDEYNMFWTPEEEIPVEEDPDDTGEGGQEEGPPPEDPAPDTVEEGPPPEDPAPDTVEEGPPTP